MTIYPRWYECDTCTRRVEMKAPELPSETSCPFCEGTMHAMREQSIDYRMGEVERVQKAWSGTMTELIPRVARLEQTVKSAPSEPGPMTSHIANWAALALWTRPEKWIDNAQSPEERARLQALLDHLHGLVLAAERGQTVPLP